MCWKGDFGVSPWWDRDARFEVLSGFGRYGFSWRYDMGWSDGGAWQIHAIVVGKGM